MTTTSTHVRTHQKQAKTREGMTPLLLAIEHAQAEAAFFLLERGANLKVRVVMLTSILRYTKSN